jgi:hypothetical protein
MNRSFRAVAYAAAIAASVALFGIAPASHRGGASAAPAAAQSTSAPSIVIAGGLALRSVNVDIPNRDRQFEGRGPTSSTTTASPAIPPAWFSLSLACPAPSGRPRSRRCGTSTRRQSMRRTSRRSSTISQICPTDRGAPRANAAVSRSPSAAVKPGAEHGARTGGGLRIAADGDSLITSSL